MESSKSAADELTPQNGSSSFLVRHERILSLCALYIACIVVLGPNVRFSAWSMSPEQNPASSEGMRWVEGYKDLPGPNTDVAHYKGHYYNIFPPLWPILCYAFFSFQTWAIGGPPVMYPLVTNLLISVPLPLLVFWAFRQTGVRPAWAAMLAFQLFAGTCMWTVGTGMHRAWIYSLQLILANTGIAMVAAGLLGRQRFWLAGIGVIIASWCRQTTLAYALAVIVLAWRSERRGKALLQAGIPLFIAMAVPMVLNQIKFDSPFETGYRYIFDPVGDPNSTLGVYDEDGKLTVFSPRFVPRHLYSMWLDLPSIDFTFEGLRIEGNKGGNAIWFATPLLLLAFVDAKKWWADPRRRWLMLSTFPIIVAHLFYHGPVIGQPGMYRYSLDFVLIWLIAVAPETTSGRRQGFAVISLGWSVLYFYTITRGFL
ncbi:MAG: hypothetical protein H6819_10695 [Phycisphaerales bacterium]|nr:hypothetical protein [Phycisphaerales bacterium]MCB9854385.1 hypothetical protein [Phycisphaerales bacterium]